MSSLFIVQSQNPTPKQATTAGRYCANLMLHSWPFCPLPIARCPVCRLLDLRVTMHANDGICCRPKRRRFFICPAEQLKSSTPAPPAAATFWCSGAWAILFCYEFGWERSSWREYRVQMCCKTSFFIVLFACYSYFLPVHSRPK